MKLVTIHKSFSAVEAQVIRSLLESASIPAEVLHETAALTTEGYALGVGGIQVQVPEDQVEDARAIIASQAPPPSPEPPTP
ncbi:MAG: putative prokaryotic signal transducing protein [Verrucomicrobiota bacterium]|jgi:hypothetical protein